MVQTTNQSKVRKLTLKFLGLNLQWWWPPSLIDQGLTSNPWLTKKVTVLFPAGQIGRFVGGPLCNDELAYKAQ